MGLNDSIYDQISTEQMHELRKITSRAATRMFEAACDLFGKMSQTPIKSAEYEDMMNRAAILMAAGREQSALCGEIGLVIWERADAHAAAAMRDGADWDSADA